MKKIRYMVGRQLCRLVFPLSVIAAAVAQGVTVTPKATDEALINPGMGFVCYHMAGRMWAYGAPVPPGDTLDWFPGTSTVYFRLLWSELEPEEGQFRWDMIDRVAQNWIAKGKKIAFRVICCNHTANACPDYVRAAGAKGIWFRYNTHGAGKEFPLRWEPVYDDPVFLEKYSAFLKAFADRYDGDPNVAFVDIGSFGMYGEGHTGSTSKLSKEETDRITRLHLKLHRRLLPNTLLVISDDVAGSGGQEPEAPLMKFARELGIGYRDDSIFCMGPEPRATYNVEGSWAHSHWARNFAPETPVVIETGHWTMCKERGRWVPERLLECVEKHQASYLSIHAFPRPYYEEHKELMAQIAKRLGYRFELRSLSCPEKVTVGEPVKVASTWANVGVSWLHGGARLTWSLVDKDGTVCWSVTDPAFDFRRLDPKLNGEEKPLSVETTCRFGCTVRNPDPDPVLVSARAAGMDPGPTYEMLKPGDYTLCVSVGSKQGTPEIALPLPNGTNRRYPLGKITVEPFVPKCRLADACDDGRPAVRWRGFNLLEMFIKGKNAKPREFLESDFRMMHDWGFNFARLPMDYRFWIVDGDWEKIDESAVAYIDRAIALGRKWGVHVQVCMHRCPGYTVARPHEERDLFADPEAQRVCALHWAYFAKRWKGVPNEALSFNLFNEPPDVAPEKYAHVVKVLVDAIRREDPKRFIVLDGLSWGKRPLAAAYGMKGVGQATRGYEPMSVSHYLAPWVGTPSAKPVWPLSLDAPAGLLAGKGKPDLRAPLEVRGLPSCRVDVRWSRVSGPVTVRFAADGKTVAEASFDPKPGAADWQGVKYYPEWKIHQGSYTGVTSFDLPAGARHLTAEVESGDWIELASLTFTAPDGRAAELAVRASWSAPQNFKQKFNGFGKEEPFTSMNAVVRPRRYADAGREYLYRRMIEPWEEALANGTFVMAGEFGVWKMTPHDIVLDVFEDYLALWKERNMGWALWNLRGSIGILDSERSDVEYEDYEGHKLDRKMLDLLRRY